MSFDITPATPEGRQVVQSYDADGFRISGVAHTGPVLILSDKTVPWAGPAASDLTARDILDALPGDFRPRIMLVGQGDRFTPPPKGLKADLSAVGMVLDWMNAKAACHTHNVLVSEDRELATIIFPAG